MAACGEEIWSRNTLVKRDRSVPQRSNEASFPGHAPVR
nr:MAG TPA: hypothetical protein [Caudoviricetes sp.]